MNKYKGMDYSSQNDATKIKMHQEKIRSFKKQLKLCETFENLTRNPHYIEVFEKWLFKDELIRLGLLHSNIDDSTKMGKKLRKDTIDAIKTISSLNEKLNALSSLQIQAKDGIEANTKAIEAIRSGEDDKGDDDE